MSPSPTIPLYADVLVFIPHSRREVILGVYQGPDPSCPGWSHISIPDEHERILSDATTGEPLSTVRFPTRWIKRLA